MRALALPRLSGAALTVLVERDQVPRSHPTGPLGFPLVWTLSLLHVLLPGAQSDDFSWKMSPSVRSLVGRFPRRMVQRAARLARMVPHSTQVPWPGGAAGRCFPPKECRKRCLSLLLAGERSRKWPQREGRNGGDCSSPTFGEEHLSVLCLMSSKKLLSAHTVHASVWVARCAHLRRARGAKSQSAARAVVDVVLCRP